MAGTACNILLLKKTWKTSLALCLPHLVAFRLEMRFLSSLCTNFRKTLSHPSVEVAPPTKYWAPQSCVQICTLDPRICLQLPLSVLQRRVLLPAQFLPLNGVGGPDSGRTPNKSCRGRDSGLLYIARREMMKDWPGSFNKALTRQLY
jgi:hypothetical protein